MVSSEQVLSGLRAALARELVVAKGFSRAEVSRILGITPSAVTQYMAGTRGASDPLLTQSKTFVSCVRQLSQTCPAAFRKHGFAGVETEMLRSAKKIVDDVSRRPFRRKVPAVLADYSKRDHWLSVLRQRLNEEQRAAKENLAFADRSRDELVKSIFRQIATDSLRHADIVSSLISYVENPEDHAFLSLPSAASLEAMIKKEEGAGEADLTELKPHLGPAGGLLIESVEADERKHLMLLKGFLRFIRQAASATE